MSTDPPPKRLRWKGDSRPTLNKQVCKVFENADVSTELESWFIPNFFR